ncbi:protocadherin alpha-C2-like [Littorina saxatilis]|uniref:protocadherin alpha-C2-like n=1 Tax=Littorina saxatilis TaxID=31220 RepID=UPI0038B56D2D
MAAPVFRFVKQPVLDPVYELTENQQRIQDVAFLDCTDMDNDDVVVKLDAVDPSTGSCSKCFQAYPNCGAAPGIHNSFCLRFLPIGTFNYRTTEEYTLTFSCTDTNGGAALQPYKIYIRLVPNTPPFFSTTGIATVANTKSTTAGDSLYNAACFDLNGDTLQYGMTTDPDTDYFRIDADGMIRAARDLNSLCRNSITFFVTCKDSFNDVVGPTTIQASLEGANDQPSITGINYNKDVPEDSPVGTVLGTFSVDDDSDPSCRIATNPPDSLQYYDLDGTGDERSIVVRSALNYEQTQTRVTNVTVICSDGLCSSSPGYLYVRVTDVNEPIDLNPKNFILSSYEGRVSTSNEIKSK